MMSVDESKYVSGSRPASMAIIGHRVRTTE